MRHFHVDIRGDTREKQVHTCTPNNRPGQFGGNCCSASCELQDAGSGVNASTIRHPTYFDQQLAFEFGALGIMISANSCDRPEGRAPASLRSRLKVI